MNKIPTAEEFFRKRKYTYSPINHHLALIEFAKLHVEAALKEASENVIVNNYVNEGGIKVNKNSIINAYPLENIK